jgi:hypothetical protein
MADDPPPPRFAFSPKNQQLGAPGRVAEPRPPRPDFPDALAEELPSEVNRRLFIEAMSNPVRREIAFNVVEKNCRVRLAEGELGIGLYQQLFFWVRLAKVDEAAAEFEQRFAPMLDQELLKRKMKEPR